MIQKHLFGSGYYDIIQFDNTDVFRMPLRRGPKKSSGNWTSMEMGNWTAMNSSKEKIASVLHKTPEHRALAIMEISSVVKQVDFPMKKKLNLTKLFHFA